MKNLKNYLLFPLLSLLFWACTPTPDSGPEDPQFSIRQVATSPNSVTIEWEDGSETETLYQVLVYDRLGNAPVQKYYVSTAAAGNRFTIPYIKKSTTYYVSVKRSNGIESTPVSISTSAKSREFDESAAVSANFDASVWGFDYMNKAQGVKLDGKSVESFSLSTIDEAINYSAATSAVSDSGGRLQVCSSHLRELLGLKSFSSQNAYLYPGCLRLGSTTAAGQLETSKLTLLRGKDMKVNVSFKVCGYSDSMNAKSSSITVELVNSVKTVVASEKCSVPSGSPKWTECKVEFDNVTRDHTIRLRTDSGAPVFIDELEILDDFQFSDDEVYGFVKDEKGNPLSGVAISNGINVVTTDEAGLYTLPRDERSYYVYYTIPADTKVPLNEYGQPAFFKKIEKGVSRYDFVLEKAEKEQIFSFFVVADTHGARSSYIERLRRECIPGLKAEAETKGAIPSYAVILGDIVCASTTEKEPEEYKQPEYMRTMRVMFGKPNIGATMFYTMGNHDHDKKYFDEPPHKDWETFNYYIQRCYEEVFGPANYSFNRGDVHIICMRDILWPESSITDETSAGCYAGFLDCQVEWLRQDLANVPKDKMVVLCVHIPLHAYYNNSSYKNVKQVVDQLKAYPNAQIFSGHSHRNSNIPSTHPMCYSKVNEMTFVGNWGHTAVRCMGDGTPFGFGVYDFEGPGIKDNYFRPCTSAKYDKNYQFRVYISDMLSGFDVVSQNNAQTRGWYGSYYATSDRKFLYTNIFNANEKWSVKAYLNGKVIGPFSYMSPSGAGDWKDYSQVPYTWAGYGTGTKTDPWRPKYEYNTNDWWYFGAIANVDNTPNKQRADATCYHMYRCEISPEDAATIKSGTAKFEVRVTDNFGNTYTSSKLYDSNDIMSCIYYQ